MEIYLCNLTMSVCLASLKEMHNRGFLQLNFLFMFPYMMGTTREEGIYHFYYFHSIQLHDFLSCMIHIVLLIVGGTSREAEEGEVEFFERSTLTIVLILFYFYYPCIYYMYLHLTMIVNSCKQLTSTVFNLFNP